jgi:hypothetical protein
MTVKRSSQISKLNQIAQLMPGLQVEGIYTYIRGNCTAQLKKSEQDREQAGKHKRQHCQVMSYILPDHVYSQWFRLSLIGSIAFDPPGHCRLLKKKETNHLVNYSPSSQKTHCPTARCYCHVSLLRGRTKVLRSSSLDRIFCCLANVDVDFHCGLHDCIQLRTIVMLIGKFAVILPPAQNQNAFRALFYWCR